MSSVTEINGQVKTLLNSDPTSAPTFSGDSEQLTNQLFGSELTLGLLGKKDAWNDQIEEKLVKNYLENQQILENAMEHNESYQKLNTVLQKSLSTATPSLRVTYILVMIYLTTHYFRLTQRDGPTLTFEIDENGKRQSDRFSYCNLDTPGTDGKSSKYPTDNTVMEFILEETPDMKLPLARTKFYHMLALLLNHQIKRNYLQMYQDAVLRIQYVLGSFYTLNQVVQQQNTSIELLTQLSEYVNEQVTEYSTVYEQLSTLIATQERKITFQTDDMQTLEGWQYWCKVGFWGLVVFFVLMVIVDHMMDISQFTSDMDGRLKRAASAAGQATQALVGSR